MRSELPTIPLFTPFPFPSPPSYGIHVPYRHSNKSTTGNHMDYFTGIYRQQRLALYPFTSTFDLSTLQAALATLDKNSRDDFFRFLGDNSLGPIWYELLGKPGFEAIWPEEQAKLLRLSALQSTASYLRQQHALNEFTETLDQHAIPHAIFKGALTRELAYGNSAMRPSCDIDLLVHSDRKDETIKLFCSLGYTLHTLKSNLTHEVSLHRGGVAVDLHWHILRPGRVPLTFTDELLAGRIRHKSFWGVGNEENLAIMMFHPVISKYSLMTRHGLIRMADLLLWLAGQSIDHPRLLRILEQTGLRTAAWISLTYLDLFTGERQVQELGEDLAPGPVHRAYLQQWLNNDLATRLTNHQPAVKLCFTLFAHDSLRQASRFLRTIFTTGLKPQS